MASSISAAQALMLLHSGGNVSLRFPLKNGSVFKQSERLGLNKRTRAIGGNSSETNEEKDGTDVLLATTQTRNKVLTLQNDLLQQVAEPKKPVSSKHSDNILKSEDTIFSYELGDKTPSTKSSPQNGSTFVEDVKKTSSTGVYLNEQMKDTLSAFFANGTELLSLEVENLEDVISESTTIEGEGENEIPPPLAGTNVMNIILVASECAPWSKTGGLGDVVGSLPKALARRGHRVMVVTPLYGNYAEAQDTGVRKMYRVDGHVNNVM